MMTRMMMQRVLRRNPRSVMASMSTHLNSASSSSCLTQTQCYSNFSLQAPFQPGSDRNFQRGVIPNGLLKWGSLGFYRTSKFATGYTPLKPKPLDSILDDRAKNLSPEELVSVWDDYHLGRGHIGASMKAKLYHLLEQRAMSCRHFVIPLWRGSGYETMFIQVQMPYMLFTGLEDYKARGTQAAPYFTATYYTEFAESKDMVLIRGDVVFTSKLSDSEAQWLLETTQSFYLNDIRYKLVERFNKETHDFEFKDVLHALEMPMG
ncbi:Atp synthase mitochondrial f1 complex assembly factor [Thalictrum thalictroides]|uniref:Atp synthase mitochondrial f1 complex assembly factor n=1 Tax=Thalictrum thalictroides TaxID=46969 RepID=A0A7J6X811_THATH|nr:Atp synthase mitochondrial f1 complex assembly factor [Thalictrum thalictroides]